MSEIDFPGAVPRPDRTGQGTAVEMSRAVASVQAMVYVAQQRPRDERAAKTRMLDACAQPELAEHAFYGYTRGGQTVSGLTIGAVVELARCWGNLDYGLTEMRRDDVYGQSEMLAYCWDMETNVADRHTFIVQHVRSGSGKRLTDPRDVYEANTNDGNRRMREAILKLLPRWYAMAAEKALRATQVKAAQSSGKPLDVRIDEALKWFADEFGVGLDQIEHKLGGVRKRWTEEDLADLRVLGRSITRRELTLEDAFPQAKVTPEELAPERPQVSAEAGAQPVDEDAQAYEQYAGESAPDEADS